MMIEHLFGRCIPGISHILHPPWPPLDRKNVLFRSRKPREKPKPFSLLAKESDDFIDPLINCCRSWSQLRSMPPQHSVDERSKCDWIVVRQLRWFWSVCEENHVDLDAFSPHRPKHPGNGTHRTRMCECTVEPNVTIHLTPP